MAHKVIWLDQARDDLHALLDYLHPRNPEAAWSYISDLEEACHRLVEFPHMGWQYNERYRALAVRNHLIFYSHNPEQRMIRIVAVIDGRRDIPNLLA